VATLVVQRHKVAHIDVHPRHSGEVSLLVSDLHVARRIAPPGPPTGVATGADHLVVTVAGAAFVAALSTGTVGH
jgi:hypothetical protein